jgi:hypothetical protein
MIVAFALAIPAMVAADPEPSNESPTKVTAGGWFISTGPGGLEGHECHLSIVADYNAKTDTWKGQGTFTDKDQLYQC